jgi:hypothetical protein
MSFQSTFHDPKKSDVMQPFYPSAQGSEASESVLDISWIGAMVPSLL